MKRLVVATGNKGKIVEIAELLAALDYEVISSNDIGFVDDVVEDGTTYEENAIIKAKAVSLICDDLVLADDSGIEIEAFNNEPGIYSARYLGHDTPYSEKNKIILDRLKDSTNRNARYVCSLALCKKGETVYTTTQIMPGVISKEPLGQGGFGYDSIFFYPPLNKGTAQMSMEEKNCVSHRGKALRELITFLKNN